MLEKSYTTYTEEGLVSIASGPGGIELVIRRLDYEPNESLGIELRIDNLRELAQAAAELLAQLEPPASTAPIVTKPDVAPPSSVN
jgi:hypothetical protein